MKPLKFYVITDPHYFKNSLGAYGKEYEEFMDFEQKCFAETQAINEAVFKYLEESKEADIVLIAGDLSFNGEKESHLAFEKELLRELKASGKAVYVVTAGHDIEPNPFAYPGKERTYVEGISFEDQYDIYRDYGYDQAISLYKERLSYVAQLADGVRLLVLCNDSPERKNVEYSEELMAWAKEQIQKAADDGQMMIAMEHYPILPGQPVFSLIPDARQKKSKDVYTMLADNGVHLIFTGHMHNQSINVVTTEKGNKFYDVCTGSLIGCPAYMRLVTIEDEKTVKIESIPVPEFEWDTNGKTGKQYMQDQFERMIRSMIFGMRTDPERLLRRFGAGDKKALYKPVKAIGKALSTWSVGKVARLFFVKAAPEIKDEKILELAIQIVRYMFEGDQPFVEGTPAGDTVLKVFKRLNPIFKTLNKKLHGSQGEEIDMYDMLKNSIGNYGISDYNATLEF
ncbi:MAG: metallophosphoesterase [Clostridiales bacterium]|nr:metallophosphoesterase [Clostridiales bacterium]